MKITVMDLRYRMDDVLKALDRNEEVKLLYHGKIKGIIRPGHKEITQRVQDHPFFKMIKSSESVDEKMASLREGRYPDLSCE